MRGVATLVALVATGGGNQVLTAMPSAGPRDRRRPAPRPARAPRPSYYLALGDSLSQGVQPDAAGASLPTGQGYADQLYAALRRGDPGLRLVKLGCSGETTAHDDRRRRICCYPAHSQLAEAISFLRAHRGQVSLITIDIGANDPDSCISRASLGAGRLCVTKSFPETAANLTKIMTGSGRRPATRCASSA